VEDKPDEIHVLEIVETGDEIKLSTFDLKTKYKKYIQTHFQGCQYLNENIGIWISVSSDFVNQWVKKSRTRERIILIQSLDFLLINSVYDGLPVPDRKTRPEIEHYKHFYYYAKISGKNFKVILKIVKPVKKRHKLYYYSLESIDKEKTARKGHG
jgi:hypothetical protein